MKVADVDQLMGVVDAQGLRLQWHLTPSCEGILGSRHAVDGGFGN